MIWYIAIGLAAGVISGMGIGGGAILIPALSIFFGLDQQTAQNINLLYFIPTAIVALVTHVRDGNIEKNVVLKLVLFGLAAAGIGSFIAIQIKPELLRKMFGFFLLAMGIVEFFKREEKQLER